MQEYAVRSIVSEPFVNQIEMIEKTLIEVRNQPSSYYGRRNNRQPSQTGHVQNQLYYKYNYYQQPEYYGYRQNFKGTGNTSVLANSITNIGNMGNVGTINGGTSIGNAGMGSIGAGNMSAGSMGAGSMGAGNNIGAIGAGNVAGNVALGSSLGFASVHSNGSSGSLDLPSLGAPTHVPQVFDDKEPKLAMFDPFDTKDYTKGGMFQPMFNSSNSILGSGFSGSSNIWGDTKTMGDAAVWG